MARHLKGTRREWDQHGRARGYLDRGTVRGSEPSDDFTGAGYLPLFTESLAAPQWRTVTGALPKSRHGSVLPVTLNQWEAAKGPAARSSWRPS